MNIDKILEFFQNNPFLNVVFLCLALIGVLATIYFYFKSIRKKEPTFSIRSINLVKDKINKIKGLEINYLNEKINNLSISKLAFYNNGKETIKSNDVANSDPLKIEIKNNGKILDADIIFQKNIANNFKLSLKKNKISIEFDYFDYAEGIVVQIVHTGKTSEDLALKGSFHGVKNIKEKSLNKSFLSKLVRPTSSLFKKKLSSKVTKKLILSFLFIAPILFLVLAFIPTEPKKIETSIWVKLIPGIIFLLLYWGTGFTIIKNRPPKGFDIYDDEYLNENKSA
jgi:hypothetical protein